VLRKLRYFWRVFSAYILPTKSQLTFWHSGPEINHNFQPDKLGEYYMPFVGKADYSGHYDSAGIPMLDYHGAIGLHYNPIAIAQYGLGNYNLFCQTGEKEYSNRFFSSADWLVENLEQNPAGLWVWNHHFDWEYRALLKAPWYSALAQGQGISLLVRAYKDTDNNKYLRSAQRAFESFLAKIEHGGVSFDDENGFTWFEEYIVSPLAPTHVLNGFIWASWGIYDFYLATGDSKAKLLFSKVINTLEANLKDFDIGYWSLYEQSGTLLKMIASPFYHKLHIVQLHVLHRITGIQYFREVADKWEGYQASRWKRSLSLGYKALFKLIYY